MQTRTGTLTPRDTITPSPSHSDPTASLGHAGLSDAPTIAYDVRERSGHGEVIGPYRLVRPLGEGGFGTVYLAEQTEPVRRRVALKLIKQGMDTKRVIGRFEAERQALAMMDHPNIARVFDAGATTDGRPYFVMELVKGEPITTYCDRHQLTIRQRLALLQDVCRAIQHAHHKGVIHRDIKPSNVMVTVADGQPIPKVIDFGIAKATGGSLDEQTAITEVRSILGTPAYMSPEQADGSGIDIDTRSDIYSLGALTYELLSGRAPFDNDQLVRMDCSGFQRHIREVEPTLPSARHSAGGELSRRISLRRGVDSHVLARTLRGDLDWIVLKALEKDRTRRYDTASALAADLERYLRYQLVEASPPSVAHRLSKFLRRNSGPVTAAAAILISLIAGLAVSTAMYLEADEQRIAAEVAKDREVLARREAEEQRDQARMAREAEASARAKADAARIEADGAKVEAEVACEEAERERDREINARTSEAEARAVADSISLFLSELLGSAVPISSRERDVTLADLLDAATERLRTQPPTSTAVEVKLRHTVGLAYYHLGRLDDCEPHLRRILELQRGLSSVSDLELADTLQKLSALIALPDVAPVHEGESCGGDSRPSPPAVLDE